MLFLQTVEVSTSIAVRIYKKYGDESISVVKEQPYRLAADVWGIGFLTADKIAQSVGIPHDSPERVKAGLQYALSQSADQGHCFLPEERLIADAVKLLQVDTGLVIECLAELGQVPEDGADPGVVREKVPGPDGGGDEPVSAVYLVPLPPRRTLPLRPAAAAAAHGPGPDAGVPGGGLGKALGWLENPHRRRPRTRAGGRREARADREGRRPHGRAGVREVLHRPLDRGAGPRPACQGAAGRPDRPGRQAALGADRSRSLHRAPAAGTQPGRGRGLRPGPAARRRPGGRGRGVHAGPAARQQAGQGRTAGGAPAVRGGRGPVAERRRRGGPAGPARREEPDPGRPAHPGLPAGPAVRCRHQRAPDQRGGSIRSPTG